MPNLSNQSYFYGGGQVPNPSNVLQSNGAPNSKAGEMGDIDVDPTNGNFYVKVSPTQWAQGGGLSGPVDTLTGGSGGARGPSAGNINLLGTANQITTTGSGSTITWSVPSTFIAPGSIAATTTLTATLGAITATNGNLVLGTSGNKILSTSVGTTTSAGANAFGSVTLVSGTATVATTSVTSSSLIYLSRMSPGATGAAALGILSVGTIVNGTSFVINSLVTANSTSVATTDVSSIAYMIVN